MLILLGALSAILFPVSVTDCRRVMHGLIQPTAAVREGQFQSRWRLRKNHQDVQGAVVATSRYHTLFLAFPGGGRSR